MVDVGRTTGSAEPVDASSARPAPARARLRHVPELDGLRGAAVAAVLLFHAGHLTGGWLGVDLFFVLSGYLITSLLLVEHRRTEATDLVAFWARRSRRILPALLVVLVVVTVYARVAMDEADRAVVRDDVVATAAFVANWHEVATGSSYFDRTQAPSPLAHTWSLSVEEQLYLLWPLAVVVVLARSRGGGRSSASAVAKVAGVLAAVSAALSIGLGFAGAGVDRLYLGTDTRAVALLLGAAVAGMRRRPGGLGATWTARLRPLSVLAAAGLAGLWWGLDGASTTTYRGGLVLASLLGAVVVAAVADPRSSALPVLGMPPLRALGRISYSTYLWHLPVFVVLSSDRTGLDGAASSAVKIVATLALATATWALVEEPVRRRRPAGWWEGRRGAVLGVGAVVAVALLAVAAMWGDGGLDRRGLDDGVASATSAPTGAPEVLVVGDSVAASLIRPVIDDPEAFGVAASRSTVNGCQAVWDGRHRARGVEGEVTAPEACPPDVEALVRRSRPDVVVVAYGGWVDAELEVDGSWRHACDPSYLTLLRRRLDQVLESAGSAGSAVVAVAAAPSTNSYRPEDSDEHLACANEELRGASAAVEVPVVDLDRWLCPDGACRQRIDGLPVRSDGVHFQGPGGALVTRWLLAQVLELAAVDGVGPVGATADPAADALASACRAYGDLTSVTDVLRTGEMAVDDIRAVLDRSFAALGPDTVGVLGSDAGDALGGLTDPQLQQGLRDLLDRVLAGQPADPATDLPPGSTERLDRAFAWLRERC